jgi:hypothetical protein
MHRTKPSPVAESDGDGAHSVACLCSCRLGKNSVEEIKSHPWFQGIDFQSLRSQPAPHLPSNAQTMQHALHDLQQLPFGQKEHQKELVKLLTSNFDRFAEASHDMRSAKHLNPTTFQAISAHGNNQALDRHHHLLQPLPMKRNMEKQQDDLAFLGYTFNFQAKDRQPSPMRLAGQTYYDQPSPIYKQLISTSTVAAQHDVSRGPVQLKLRNPASTPATPVAAPTKSDSHSWNSSAVAHLGGRGLFGSCLAGEGCADVNCVAEGDSSCSSIGHDQTSKTGK